MTAPARKSSISHRKSLRLPHRPIAPIPPSLLQSPYLDPQSIFQRTLSAPHYPTEEDEKWLQDTVPLEHNKRLSTSSTSSSSSFSSPTSSEDYTQLRPQSIDPIHIPTSPPIIRWRRPPHILGSTLHEPSRMRSVSCVARQDGFIQSIGPTLIPASPIAQRRHPRHILSSAWHEPPRPRSAPPCVPEQHEFPPTCRP